MVTHCGTFMMVYDDTMMQMVLISDYVGINGSLSITWLYLLIKSGLTKSANCSKPVSSFLSYITHVILLSTGSTYACLLSIFG
jgi:hypothetical protein